MKWNRKTAIQLFDSYPAILVQSAWYPIPVLSELDFLNEFYCGQCMRMFGGVVYFALRFVRTHPASMALAAMAMASVFWLPNRLIKYLPRVVLQRSNKAGPLQQALLALHLLAVLWGFRLFGEWLSEPPRPFRRKYCFFGPNDLQSCWPWFPLPRQTCVRLNSTPHACSRVELLKIYLLC